MDLHFTHQLTCKNSACSKPIPLLRSTRLVKNPLDQVTSGYFESFVCPDCNHAYDYTTSDVGSQLQSAQATLPERKIAGLINLDCETADCGMRVIIQKPIRADIKPNELVEDSNGWVLAGVHCKKGHLITKLPQHRWAAAWPSDVVGQ